MNLKEIFIKNTKKKYFYRNTVIVAFLLILLGAFFSPRNIVNKSFDEEIQRLKKNNYKISLSEKAHFLDYYKELKKNYNPSISNRDQAYLSFYFGYLHYKLLKDNEKANVFLQQAYKSVEYLDQDAQQVLLYTLGKLETENTNFAEAVFFFELNCKKGTFDKELFFRSHLELAKLYLLQNSFAAAEKHTQSALQTAMQVNNQQYILGCLLLKTETEGLKKNISRQKMMIDLAFRNTFLKKNPKLWTSFYYQKVHYFQTIDKTDSLEIFGLQYLQLQKKGLNFYNRKERLLVFAALGELYKAKDQQKLAESYYERGFQEGIDSYNIQTLNLGKSLLEISDNDRLRSLVYQYISSYYNFISNLDKEKAKYLEYFQTLERKQHLLELSQRKKKNALFVGLILIVLIFLVAYIIYIQVKRKTIVDRRKKILEHFNKKIQIANEKLININFELTNFSLVTAHDIKSTIISIKYSLGKISEQNTVRQDLMKEIHSEINSLSETIDYLSFASGDHQNSNLIPQEFDMCEIVELVLNDQLIYIDRGNLVITHLQQEVYFQGYKSQIYQLIKNFLTYWILQSSNFQKNVTLQIAYKIFDDNLQLFFTFDTMIVTENESQVLEDFFKNAASFFELKNFGVHLNICKKIIENYNGNVQIKNAENKTEVIFSLKKHQN